MAIPRGGFILIGPPMLGCPARTERTEAQVKATYGRLISYILQTVLHPNLITLTLLVPVI